MVNKNLEQQIRTLCNAWLNEYAPFGGSCPNDWELTPLASFAKFIKVAEVQRNYAAGNELLS